MKASKLRRGKLSELQALQPKKLATIAKQLKKEKIK